MIFVKRKATMSKSKYSIADFNELSSQLRSDWDQDRTWTMDVKGVSRVEVNDKRQITAVFCASIIEDFLPIQLVYAGKTTRCHLKLTFPPSGWHVTHSQKHWSNEDDWISRKHHCAICRAN